MCKLGISKIVASLATCEQLEALDLRGSRAELTARLASALTCCPALRKLWIKQARYASEYVMDVPMKCHISGLTGRRLATPCRPC